MAQMADLSFPEQFTFPNSEFRIFCITSNFRIFIDRIKYSFPYFKDCQARVTRGLGQTLKHRKIMLYRHCDIPSMAQMAHFSFPEQFKFPNSEFRILNSEYFALLRISEFLFFIINRINKSVADNIIRP